MTIGLAGVGYIIRQFVIEPRVKEKKEKLSIHRQDIINIFQKWTELQVTPVNIKDSLHDTLIPFYLEIVEKIDSLDGYGDARFHLKDKKYSESLSLYKEMDKLEKSHNQTVSEFLEKTETKIRDKIEKEIHLKDVNYMKKIYSDTNTLKEVIEKGEFDQKALNATKLGALDGTIGIYFDNLFDHLVKQGNNNKKDVLIVETISNPNYRWLFPILVRSDSRNKIIAKGIPGSGHSSIEKLKILIENEFESESILIQLKDFQDEVNQMEELFTRFSIQLQKITHDSAIFGIYGNCRIEDKIKFKRKFIKSLKSFFRLKGSI